MKLVKSKSGRKREVFNLHTSAENCVISVPDQANVASQLLANTLRIEHANIFGGDTHGRIEARAGT